MVGQAQAEGCISDKAIQQYFKVCTKNSTHFKFERWSIFSTCCSLYLRSWQNVLRILSWMSSPSCSSQLRGFRLIRLYWRSADSFDLWRLCAACTKFVLLSSHECISMVHLFLITGVNQEQGQKWPKLLSLRRRLFHGVQFAVEVRQPVPGVPHRELPSSSDRTGRTCETGKHTRFTSWWDIWQSSPTNR